MLKSSLTALVVSLFLFFCGSVMADGPYYHITGRVTGPMSQPLAGVIVSCSAKVYERDGSFYVWPFTATTDANGMWVIDDSIVDANSAACSATVTGLSKAGYTQDILGSGIKQAQPTTAPGTLVFVITSTMTQNP